MIKEVAKDIYTFPVTLPNNPLKALNVYVIKGDDRTVIFDTGFNTEESKADLLNGLKELDLEPKDVEVVLTHLHSDHVGLVNLFTEAGSKVYAGKVDGKLINQMTNYEYWARLENFIPLYGMEKNEINTAENPGYKNRLKNPIDFIELKVGEYFNVGDYQFEVLDLSGHTPGHLGFYDADKKIILSADTILDPITPNITFWGFDYPNILNTYVETLKGLKEREIDFALATHRKIITNVNERIDELISHHDERLQEILDAMDSNETYSVRDISANISWRIRADNWDEFPRSQKWFAVGETMAHLHHLANTNRVKMEEKNGELEFTKLEEKIIPFVQ